MKKRLLSVLLALTMVLGILPVTVFADKFTDPSIDFIDVTDPANLGRAVTDGNGHYVDTFAHAAKQQGYIWLEKITLDSAIAWSTEGSTTPVDTVDKVEGTRYVNEKWLSYESDSHTLGKYDGEYVWVTLQSIKLYDIKNQCYVEPTTSAWLTLDPDNDALSGGDVVPVGMYAQEYYYDVWTDLYLEVIEPMWVGFPSGSENMTVTMDGQTLKPRSEAWTESLGSHTPGMYWVMGGGTAGSSFKTTYPSIARGLFVNSPVHYVYDVKPVINSVTVNGQGGAYNNNYVANNGTVTIKTNYDSKLSDALTAYGCSVKQLSAHYLNGEKITVAAPIPVDNGDGTATKTYNRTLNPGDELRVESWLEVRWPDGHRDRVDEHTVTVSGPSRQFITQPHYAGDGMQTGENYVAWKLNFTPIKLIARYNLGTADRPNWKEVELDATKSRASLPAISQKYTLYAFYGTGARDYVASDAFSATDPVEFTPAFTLQPANGVSLGGAYAETTWATNFTPVTLALVKINYAPNGRPLYTYEELDVNATYCTVQPGFDEYCIRAYYNDTEYVDSNKFIVTEMNYYNAWFYVDDTVLDKVMVLEGDYVERPADPVKDGYTFLGWYTDDGEAYNFAAPVTADVHLTAKFEVVATFLKGDFDADGVITVSDALAALRIAAKIVEETAEAIEIGDMDSDGKITVSDALAILRIAAKIV